LGILREHPISKSDDIYQNIYQKKGKASMARLGPSIPKDDEGNKMPKKLSRALKEGRPGTREKN
jgi:hypothetical protein